MAKIGWIGLGDIGEPMALQLIKAGHEVSVWGRTQARLKSALDAGARAASSPAELARPCEAVFLCITDGDAVDQTVFGADGIAAGANAGSTLIDHSTIHPHRSRVMAERLRMQTGMAWLDAPVSGGRVGAQEGTLSIFVGGDEADLQKVRGLMTAYARKITCVGPSGSGQVAKTVNQTVLCATLAAWAEALNYAHRAGADVALTLDALEGSWSDSPVRRLHAPKMVSGDFKSGPVSTMLKDMDIVSDMARVTKSPMPVQSLCQQLFRQQIAMGYDANGIAGIVSVYHQGPMGKPKG